MEAAAGKYRALMDEELFLRIRENGDLDALGELYNRYAAEVYAYCLRMVGEKAAAEDLYQDIFLRMYRYRDHFHGGNFAHWLFTIARTQCLNYLRRQKPTVQENFLDSPEFAEDPQWENGLLLSEYVEKALQQLPEPYREVLILRYYRDLSFQQIAEELGISLSLAKVRAFRALRSLRTILAPILQEYKYDEE